MTEMVESPMSGSMSMPTDADRETTLSRFEDLGVTSFVRSVPDSLLMLDEEGKVRKISLLLIFLQITTSVMVATSQLTHKVRVYPSFTNIVTCIAASLAIAASIHNSTMEFWVNNQCIELLKKANPADKQVRLKDEQITLYYFGQVAFGFATIVSIVQQPDAVSIITNGTGLLLIQGLDQGVFSCLKIPAKASHVMKEKLKEVAKDPKFSSQKIFFGSFTAIYASIILLMAFISN